jgi:hypothetical protein
MSCRFPPITRFAHVTGYWFGESTRTWAPPGDLLEFLDRGHPTIYLGFGSMGFGGKAEGRGRLVAAALSAAGVRAVVSTGWGALAIEPSEHIFPVDEVPHNWLFPRVDAVVHHGGSGTTAAGLRAGKPALICPVLGDQPFWGNRVQALGAGPQPVPLRRATPETLGKRIVDLVTNPAYATAAATVSAQIASEDEPTNALDPSGVILLREAILRRAHSGAGVLVSSHHLDEVARIADRIAVMNDGRIIGTLDPGATDLERAFFSLLHADDLSRRPA